MSPFEYLGFGLIYVFIGAFAGIMAGILGIGGGIIVVPGLLFIFQATQLIPEPLRMQVAAGTSLSIMILTSQASLRAHLKLGEVLWPIFKKMWPGLLLGTILGVLAANRIPTDWLKRLFAIFLLLVAIKMAMDIHVSYKERFPSTRLNFLINVLIGLQSGLLGIGGGLLIVPYLSYCGLDVRKITAITNLCTLLVSCVGTLMFMITGSVYMTKISYSTGYIYWPAVFSVAIPSMLFAPLGARLNYALPLNQIKYTFILILLVTACSLLF